MTVEADTIQPSCVSKASPGAVSPVLVFAFSVELPHSWPIICGKQAHAMAQHRQLLIGLPEVLSS